MVAPTSTLQPLGSFFAPPSQLAPPSPLLADNIDPATKDFRSLFVGADPIDDQVQVAVSTAKASGGSVLDDGIQLTTNKLDSRAEVVLESDVRVALRRLTRNRDIRFSGISYGVDEQGNATGEFDRSNEYAQVNVAYVNLRALDPTVRSVPLKSTAQR